MSNENEQRLSELLEDAAEEMHANAVRHGFWEGGKSDPEYLASKVALMHSELSELLEAIRKDPLAPCPKVPAITCEEEEVADLFIRLLDYCGARGIQLGRAAALKHAYNLTRPHKHGKQF
jgi:NTP pyrophosphatase (non-canonical NTP hydrolase)